MSAKAITWVQGNIKKIKKANFELYATHIDSAVMMSIHNLAAIRFSEE